MNQLEEVFQQIDECQSINDLKELIKNQIKLLDQIGFPEICNGWRITERAVDKAIKLYQE